LALGLVTSLVLTGISSFTAPYREANENADQIRNFFAALNVPVEKTAPPQQLIDTFNQVMAEKEQDGLTIYEYRPDPTAGEPAAVAVPIAGSGLWGEVVGVVALEPDLVTIRGLRFYQQEETPGLGGEIGSKWFQEQFEGKKLISSRGEPGFSITKPDTASAQNEVDGITGATMTSDRVETIIDNLAKQLHEVRDRYGR
jgi:Na+-transporting NADH:ubiquinone oxidoreductase subunit C